MSLSVRTVLTCLLMAGGARGAAPYRVGRAPAWIERVSVPEVGVPAKEAREDLQQLLVDQQDRFSPESGAEEYRHYAFRLLTAAGVHDDSELTIDMDGSYQELTLHAVTIHRDGKPLDVLRASEIRITSRQSDEDARMYDDGLSVHVLVPGTRVGDTVEYSYTRRGSNPAVSGHFARMYTLARSVPVGTAYQRVLYGGSATLGARVERSAVAPERRTTRGFQDLVFRESPVPAVESEDDLPAGYEPFPWIEVSDFESWASVVSWALPLYEQPLTLTREGEALVETWGKEPDPGRRLIRALRFVQDDIRYLGMEVGPGSFVPRPPAKTLSDRFGDCKDKSLLLVTFLRRLGIVSSPVLVSASAPRVTPDTLPSPFAFDHVIVKARLGEREVFLDATSTHERGGAERIRSPALGLGLVVDRGVTGLQQIPEDPQGGPTVDIVELFQVDGAKRAELRVKTQYLGDDAVKQRQRFAYESEDHAQREYENFYAKLFHTADVAEPLRLVDHEETNTIEVAEHYRIEPFWEEGTRTIRAWAIREHLQEPSVVKRTMPLAVPHPLHVRETFEIDGDDGAELDLPPVSLDGPGLRFSREGERKGRHLRVVYRLDSLADRVKAEDVPRYLALMDDIFDETSFEIRAPVIEAAGRAATSRWTVRGLLGLVAAGLVLAYRTRRRRRSRTLGRALGETPGTAIEVATAEQAILSAAKIRCACGARQARSPVQASTVRFGNRVLTVIEALCPSCEARIARYYAVPGSGQDRI